jgi:uncharacterized SAM-binding protein YcdF (DUF218 family)
MLCGVQRLRRWSRIVSTTLCLWALVHLAAICVDGCTDDGAPADLAVVLGNHVDAVGEPSLRLQLRLDAALALYRGGLVPRVIVSGGRDPGSPFEAEVMKRYLVERGVPADAVIEDRGGVNTQATARFTAAYMREHDLRSVVAVSQYFHITRCKLALRRSGVATVYGAHAPVRLELREPWSWLREVVGYYSYLLRDYD